MIVKKIKKIRNWFSKMEKIQMISEQENIRLDLWISNRIGEISRSYAKQLIESDMISVNGKKEKAGYKIKINDEILVCLPEPQKLNLIAEQIDISILYEDEDILVIDKPRGMVVHPAVGNYNGTLVNALMNYCKDNLSNINGVIRPGIVHRIDKDTSGTLVVAKNNKAHEFLSQKLKIHDVKRVYIALVHGVIKEDRGRIEAPIGRHPVDRKKMSVNIKNGRRAITHFEVIERFKDVTYVELSLETGRTHQIRVHMSHIGYPLIGDCVYGRKKEKYNIEGQALHAKVLGFEHPLKHEYMEFLAPIPQYFEDLLKTLKDE